MKPVRILVVEDERIVALNLKQRLTKMGYEVLDIVTTGEAALAVVQDQSPDIILMDIHIDGKMDGVETAAHIYQGAHIPVIYLTAYSEEATLERARQTEPYGYLIKPFSERELHATIQMAVARREVDLAIAENERRLETANAALEAEVEERRRAEAATKETNELLSTVLDSTPIPLIVTTVDGTVMAWNQAAHETYGYTAEEMLGGDASQLVPQESMGMAMSVRRTSAAGEAVHGMEIGCLHKDGRRLLANLYVAPVYATDKSVRGMVLCLEDLTERRSMEAQLRQAQKMESIGQLSGGIAHDFNNLLAIISGNLELILEQDDTDSATSGMVSSALDACLRGANLTHRLLAYARNQALEPAAVNVGAMVGKSVQLLEHTLEESIHIKTNLRDDLWTVRIDGAQLQDAILNLAINARDAMPNGGVLVFEANNTTLDIDYAEHNLEVTPGDYVMIALSDTGIGIAPEMIDRVVEPFFTTKPLGKGSGLGLSMVYGFIKQSGGHLKIYSEPGKGTTIKMYLPRADKATPAYVAQEDDDSPLLANSGEVILIVEDDETVRRIGVNFLSGFGYKVVEASDGPVALQILRDADRIDLLFTDIVLPNGLSGPEVAEAAKRLKPDIKVLYMSGYTSDALMHRGELGAGVQLLTKPFLRKDLGRKVRLIMDTDLS